jgi:hypothetical protein
LEQSLRWQPLGTVYNKLGTAEQDKGGQPRRSR